MIQKGIDHRMLAVAIWRFQPYYLSKYKKFGVLLIRIVKSNVSSVGPSSQKNRK